ncbi:MULTISPECIES: NAD-dependent epimerase/dehydratase family protein [Bacillus]|uniref:NAD-dependent epimerase/dehydratase family protein n=1 Tax=Bacillus TaxID=1386 RepID=UPI0012AC62A4|nr:MULTISPECIES: NAD-dependent epimerase/dehydratase family protein [Bacillus]MBY7112131.1 NAD-dependent epimerase/dehydratase family protein [Bacillus sp. 17RED48]MCU5600200.1 NAD-dependent epimerase/dehydratase family protein [Bacillus wiedmannii]MCX3316164.1 NAD-dependent epimerase/dehydratase family protein [Bacillus wiedmannii]MRS26397.1 NAD-dependent epimerase/dehydratase family protein [Bacillus sp. RIT694]
MNTYLVTGGAGFIGSHLVHALLKQGKEVKVLDNLYSGKEENLKGVLHDIKLIIGDITDYHTVKNALKGVDVVYHLAAVPSVPRSIVNPMLSNKVNITGTLQLLHVALELNVRRFIYSSSSSIYGNSNFIIKKENMAPAPLSPYAISKYAGELYCKTFYELYGLETVSLRYFNVFGPKQDSQSEFAAVIPKFISTIHQNHYPIIYGDGTQTRDFTYVDNVVSANLLASDAEKLHGEVINIGCGNGISLNSLVDNINLLLGKQTISTYTESKKGDVRHSIANIQKAESLLSYRPLVSFDEGLKSTIRWYKDNFNKK